jgi:hypothetical protein
MFAALQRTDPRCPNQGPVLDEDKHALAQLEEIVKTLKASVDSKSK